ncbi:exodeoxyribonuclease VII small subunit [Candidatus Curtissbacteria bacterium RIFCSPHIGHO2_02_FULL_40_17]|uniref:Exodeoxyribonuclease 7 small subunit n=4 Tax=Candidatus Curtissiibacteriota TaxID=1752717 RepID=A0A1F5GGS9_9BACT|nr:MAG: exodeoxyribonuclease VII small subunit [Candidatus Curtissbacteria bacterium RIFCSPHIGHO2_01_FULL_40_12]OGD91073.1 MAG: exodeoxyribonuclease VII small subunit [Candidatus Curtissbacteria bacterium RIFCSPHIGHO2_02_FULL_40_17]OGE05483.1 MAG: exodeoxyribonuclease VII small subunit [Candidatus Curtissbacteria bacterium RIFCSPHIGHO2_12_FULL_41_17]OGE07115.1 MAG: exodeoxyribonuclease VII small subunit [Candidatus Curtissbacteria bacterium RIFCSPLOWO2_02_FULL_40_13b]
MSKNSKDLNFTKALKRLEEIVETLEDPNMDLEEGLKLLEEGVKLHKFCKSKLTEANIKISSILKDGDFSKKGVN